MDTKIPEGAAMAYENKRVLLQGTIVAIVLSVILGTASLAQDTVAGEILPKEPELALELSERVNIISSTSLDEAAQVQAKIAVTQASIAELEANIATIKADIAELEAKDTLAGKDRKKMYLLKKELIASLGEQVVLEEQETALEKQETALERQETALIKKRVAVSAAILEAEKSVTATQERILENLDEINSELK